MNFKYAVESLEQQEIAGSIFVKAEWEGFGEYMPPAKAESLFHGTGAHKNRIKYSKKIQKDVINRHKTIDVNDPRYEQVIKKLQLAKNNYLEKLLENDAKF